MVKYSRLIWGETIDEPTTVWKLKLYLLQVITLEHPYGKCKENQEAVSTCQSKCKAEQMAKICKCSDVYVQLDNGKTYREKVQFVFILLNPKSGGKISRHSNFIDIHD